MSNIEDKVLDSDLFLREAKKYVATLHQNQRTKFYNVLSKSFDIDFGLCFIF